MSSIGAVLRRRRRELGYTQSEVAAFCGFSQRLISEIERGRETVAIDKVMRYANGLGIDFLLRIRGKHD
ncbi:MAG: helix-turn-helix domain-containing protein [Coriobacteriaceae bacterium]|nr:helix-turn-helix domain-containing protein [Coriobacteriaceae bacterium]